MNKVLLWIIFLGTFIRLIYIEQPLLEGASTRQIQTAMIARNFYENGFQFFYPQADGFGKNPGYLMQELYFIPFLAAYGYHLLGGVHEWLLRAFSVLFYILSSMMLFYLVSHYVNKRAAIFSVAAFALSPLSIYLGRAVHPEMAIIFFNISSLHFFSKYLENERLSYGLLSFFSLLFSVFLKISNLYLLLPLFSIAYLKHGFHFYKIPRFFWLLIICGIPLILFNYHQYWVREKFPNVDMENFKWYTIIHSIKIHWFSLQFYKSQFDHFISYTLTPVGAGLCAMYFLLKSNNQKENMIYIWIASIVIFFMVMPEQSMQGYYQAHALPVICLMIGKVIDMYFFDFFSSRKIAATFAIVFILILVFRYSFGFYRVPIFSRYVMVMAKAIQDTVPNDAWIIFASKDRDHDVLYYSHRKGWLYRLDKSRKSEKKLIQELEFLKNEGANYFVSKTHELLNCPNVFAYLIEKHKVIQKSDIYHIFYLN